MRKSISKAKTENPQSIAKIALVAFIALLLPIIPCEAASNPSALLGRWVGVSGEEKDFVIELLSDGTGIATKGSVGVAITWKTDNGRFYSTASGLAEAENYKLQGSLLTFTKDNGKINEYMKCNKNCQETAKEYAKAQAEKATADSNKAYKKAKAEYEAMFQNQKMEAEAETRAKKTKKGSFTDERDSKTYKTVKIDNQTWMAENLNYDAEGSQCYENDPANCTVYGKLYDWETAMKACPKGWHLPSKDEWLVLVNFTGGYIKEYNTNVKYSLLAYAVASKVLKSRNGWNDYIPCYKPAGLESDECEIKGEKRACNGSDIFGFSALPSGQRRSKFVDVGVGSLWWSATENNASRSYFTGIRYELFLLSSKNKQDFHSVRCIQDSP